MARKSIFLLAILVLLAFYTNKTFADYRSDAEAINASANPKASINEDTAQNVVPNYNGGNAPESNYYNNPSAMETQSQTEAQSSDSGKVTRSAFNNKGDYNLNYLPKDNSSTIDVSSVIRLFTNAYQDCQTSTTTNPGIITTNICDQYYQAKENSCQISRNIQVESNFTYSCTKDLIFTPKTCRKILNLSCLASNSDCSSSLNFTITDGNGTYSYPNLSINTPTIGGSCVYATKIMNFNVVDVSQITWFTLDHVNYNDFASVKINGVILFNNIPAKVKRCEMGAPRDTFPNQDLKPYLINGSNQIEVKALIGGAGNANAYFTIRQQCCTSFQENWQEACS